MRWWASASLAAFAVGASAQTWPFPDDIPHPAPVSVGLAGSPEPDVTRFLLAQGPSEASLSPDGTQLLYVSSITGKPQLWVAPTAGGAPRQLTFGLGVESGAWSPDGRLIVYGADRGGNERYGFYSITPDGMRETEVVPQSPAFTVLGDFVLGGRAIAYATAARDGRNFDTWVAPISGGSAREALRGRMGLYPALANPTGTALAMVEARGEDGRDLSLLDLASGKERVLSRPAAPAMNAPMAWSPDGRYLYNLTNDGREYIALAKLDTTTGESRFVEQDAADLVGAALSFDGRYLAWLTDKGGFHRLHARDLRSGRTLKVQTLPPGTLRISFARRAPVLAVSVDGPGTPGEVWSWDMVTGDTHQLVAPSTAGVDLKTLVVPTVVHFTARDGVPLSGLLYRPARTDRPTPVFLRLHGGPSSHALANWKPDVQYLVARGIAVLDFNYRGSTGAGKKLAHLNDKRLRPNEIGDLLDAVAWIKQQPGLDGSRVAVGGASYGGYLTNAVVGKHPGVFVAAISEVGVADWPRNLRNASPRLKASDRLEYGDIDDPSDQAFFASISPMKDAARVRTPMLIQSGANDPRNGAEELDAYVAAIRKAGGKVQYRRYENEGHVMRDLVDIADMERAKARFLEEQFRAARPRS
ncbi:S9 family peptidase [Sphingomonas aerophila]|uniref:Acyl-peptide hydrolase n=1 Tax=Sphingomonas aerophila TaxID=1344948 RepID=A0A7W9EXP5_9SPHN|nr:prolyl oligopeptidase family serine peptidase [Sphingomonas aerophila]MBB5717022.1 dipeptidyl aminopeptidase/acylaminoacyl peptidase [Sphingomonas aerophila]